MGLRRRRGKWNFRIWVNGACYSEVTALDDTERNRNAAIAAMEKRRKEVLEGRTAESRKINVVRFSEAVDAFLAWADSEYREHPNSARRIRTSFATLGPFFGKHPVSGVTEGLIEDYKAVRRKRDQIREITLRHDLHALSTFFRYAIKHTWARTNPVKGVSIPSDKDAVRLHVLTPAEEMLYFTTCLLPRKTVAVKGTMRSNGRYMPAYKRTFDTDARDVHDLGRIMLLQGCRPEEVLALRKQDVDLERGLLRIPGGKSTAAKRDLKLLAETRDLLAARTASQSPWIFPSPIKPGAHLTKLNNAHNRILEDCDLDFVLYDFRHTAATRWAEWGMPLATLAKILGHSSLRSVMKYVHPSQQHMDDALLRFDSNRVGYGSVASVKSDDFGLSRVMKNEIDDRPEIAGFKGKVQ